MLNTTRCLLALCLSAFLAGAAGAQTPPSDPQTPPPQTPPPPSDPQTPPPQTPPPSDPQTPPPQTPPPGDPQTPPQTPPPGEPQTPPPPGEPQTPPPGEPQTPPQTPPPTEPQTPPPTEPQTPPVEPQKPPTEPEKPPVEPQAPAPKPSPKKTGFFAGFLPRLFVSGNGGYQIIDSKFATSSTFEAYEETATLTSNGELKSEPVFDASVGYMVTDKLGVSVGLSYYVTENDVEVVATVPHPLFFDRPRIATYSAAGVKHSSPALHFNAVYFIPFTTQIEFSVSAGPSIVMVTQDVIASANLQPETPPFLTPNITSVNVEEVGKTTLGFNVGADAVYSVTRRYGVGVTVRYMFASADIEGLTDNLKVSGLQILGGLRLKF